MSHLFPTYSRWEVEPDIAEGCFIIGKDGKRYLDFTSGIGVCNLGHRPKAVQEAVNSQLNRFWHVSNLFVQGEQEAAAKRLADGANMDLVFFANSGAEANEAAIKLARKATGRKKIITFENSFHGRTFATMSATGQEKIKAGFGPMLETFTYLPLNDIEAVKQAIDSETAAVMLEVVQGEGGIHIGEQEFLNEVGQLCKKNGALYIIDEIQTGVGRTGKPFAFQHFQLTPDIVTTAKGLGSGLPIGAVIGRKEQAHFFGPGSHGSTFGGNPLAIAAANATMEIIFEKEFLKVVEKNSEYLYEQMSKKLGSLPAITEIRQLGMMIGLETSADVPLLVKELRMDGLLTLSAGHNVLRLLPPLTVKETEIDEAVEILQSVLISYSNAAV
ncbi:acetylornithine transaminase [Cytobacillus sp. FJAT-53684]|uniref:Acetylornithine aminotransferase n=1 Tax=Cytobacillus mangrovibacter TaxID=3299024 RepID=A0ABW6JZ44_9BACI